jgi:hypothetical protein
MVDFFFTEARIPEVHIGRASVMLILLIILCL